MSDDTLIPCLATSPTTGFAAYAHLRHEESVLVTGWRRTGADAFTVGVRWPAAFGDLPYDPRLLTQTIRQSGLLVAHAAYDVPLAHQTMLDTLDFTVAPRFRAPLGRPSELEVRVGVKETAGNRRAASSLRMRIHLVRDGVTVSRAETEFRWISPRVYERVRGDRLAYDWGSWPVPAPVAAELTGRASAADVALAPGDGPRRWLLRNDTGNRLLFDHPVDHVPGLTLLEAADQAAQALLAPARLMATRITTTYHRYVEFDEPCWIEAAFLPAPAPGLCAVRVTGTQSGKEAFRVRLGGVARESGDTVAPGDAMTPGLPAY
ncbi:ScbA/BarX family gamma-butyrolactone biosynthesis protein [Streptomyces liangshanensis]|uniref:ScbA/BarX family gamma-butyrolactone biosynthesis protein n=1 Tax=Streptomyces liangshanensis TaxID=2717324 RepID=UPI001FBA4521|nr:ScbA/BarX family gamma-butyrolactone biosynthesis protein [Streptomyces liangshanensis]